MGYAQHTQVSEVKSRAEIEDSLIRYGASSFGYMRDGSRATICFVYRRIRVQMFIKLPDAEDKRFILTATGRRKRANINVLYEQEVRRRWRCLALAIKGKLVAVADGVASFEQEFLPYMVTDDGRTVSQRLLPNVEQATKGDGLISAKLLLMDGTDPEPERKRKFVESTQ